ncbi:CAPN15 [Mytilus edulis]|uniref:CAPN15 n=1 Tax=Mytilus edulis TaxID=6550 RepID=A0A8S3UZ71_MYTED|nr:CAPN15 [Mytilus edulis]
MRSSIWLLFICALAVVAERKELLERIVVTKDYCPEGAYVVRLCKDGIWKTVVLDDYFPVDQYKRLKYSTARKGQLWVPLIEKAAAKIHGCYQALTSGRTVESLSLLTGEPCEHLSLNEAKDFSKTIDNTLIWSKLTDARDCGYMMCTSCEAKDGFTPEYCKSLGLITGHAYSLLDVYGMDTGDRLLKIRNPWGSESWNGDWSDNSSKWQKVKPDVKKELKPDGNTHGIFWIEFREFRKHFGSVEICKTRDWHETRIKGSFPSTADGPWKFVKIYVPKKTDLCIGLHQKNKRGNSSKDDFVDLLIVVMEIMEDRKMRTVGHSKRDIKSYVGCEIEHLQSGEYIVACLSFKHLDRDRRCKDRLTMAYKIRNRLVDIDPSNYYKPGDSRTRGGHRIHQQRTLKDQYRYSFFPRSTREWNTLPEKATTAATLEEFKASLTILPEALTGASHT